MQTLDSHVFGHAKRNKKTTNIVMTVTQNKIYLILHKGNISSFILCSSASISNLRSQFQYADKSCAVITNDCWKGLNSVAPDFLLPPTSHKVTSPHPDIKTGFLHQRANTGKEKRISCHLRVNIFEMAFVMPIRVEHICKKRNRIKRKYIGLHPLVHVFSCWVYTIPALEWN